LYEATAVGNGSGDNSYSRFPDPYMDMASTAMPKDIKSAMRWCQFIVSVNNTYESAIRRVLSYFLTDVEIAAKNKAADGKDDIGEDEKSKYLEFLNDVLGIRSVLMDVGMDYLVYGNSWTSVLLPFRRHLLCKRCGRDMPIRVAYEDSAYKLEWADYKFIITCPRCKTRGEATRVDRRSSEPERVRIKRWSPMEIDILHDYVTDRAEYIWRIPSEAKNDITRGDLLHLEETPWEVIQAIKDNKHFRFYQDSIYHMREATLAGIMSRGYGISRVLTNFKQAWYVQILHRFNETIAMDYMVPWRVVSPAARGGATAESSDPLVSINMSDFVSHGNRMVRDHRRDPASVHFFPYPLTYQTLGGEASQLAPAELLDQGLKTLLDGIGVPLELYTGTLTAQTAPASLRLFEANWTHLTYQLNRFLQHVVDRVARVMNWEPVKCQLAKVTHADDLNRQMAQLQLMQANMISQTTGLKSVGLNKAEESRLMLEEQKEDAKQQQKGQDQMQQQQLMSQMTAPPPPPEGGAPTNFGSGSLTPPASSQAPPQGGAAAAFAASQPLIPNAPTSLEELQGIADTLAQQAMAMPSQGQKVSFMLQLRKENPTVHALVKSKLDDIKRQAELQGRDAVLQQQYGQGQAPQ
jgi:hypothetical protein